MLSLPSPRRHLVLVSCTVLALGLTASPVVADNADDEEPQGAMVQVIGPDDLDEDVGRRFYDVDVDPDGQVIALTDAAVVAFSSDDAPEVIAEITPDEDPASDALVEPASLVVADDGTTYVGDAAIGGVRAIDTDGTVTTPFTTGSGDDDGESPEVSITAGGDDVYVAVEDAGIHALTTDGDGEEIVPAEEMESGSVTGLAAEPDNALYVATDEDVHQVEDGELTSALGIVGTSAYDLAVDDDTVYLARRHELGVYRDGDLEHVPTPTSMKQIALDDDDRMYFISPGATSIWRTTDLDPDVDLPPIQRGEPYDPQRYLSEDEDRILDLAAGSDTNSLSAARDLTMSSDGTVVLGVPDSVRTSQVSGVSATPMSNDPIVSVSAADDSVLFVQNATLYQGFSDGSLTMLAHPADQVSVGQDAVYVALGNTISTLTEDREEVVEYAHLDGQTEVKGMAEIDNGLLVLNHEQHELLLVDHSGVPSTVASLPDDGFEPVALAASPDGTAYVAGTYAEHPSGEGAGDGIEEPPTVPAILRVSPEGETARIMLSSASGTAEELPAAADEIRFTGIGGLALDGADNLYFLDDATPYVLHNAAEAPEIRLYSNTMIMLGGTAMALLLAGGVLWLVHEKRRRRASENTSDTS